MPQNGNPTEPGLGAPLLKVLGARVGKRTVVRLETGEDLDIYNIVWIRDAGAAWEFVIANSLPEVAGVGAHSFHTSDIESLIDPDTGTVLFQQTPDPREERRAFIALAWMAEQYLRRQDGPELDNLCMSAGEYAFQVLSRHGFLEVEPGNRFGTWTEEGQRLLDERF